MVYPPHKNSSNMPTFSTYFPPLAESKEEIEELKRKVFALEAEVERLKEINGIQND